MRKCDFATARNAVEASRDGGRVQLLVLPQSDKFVVSDFNEADETAHGDMKIKRIVRSNARVWHCTRDVIVQEKYEGL